MRLKTFKKYNHWVSSKFYHFLLKNRSRRSQIFVKIGVLKNFANFAGKHLCWSLFLINLGQNIWRLFHVLTQFLFTASETELDYYHQKVNVRVASRVAEPPKTYYDLRRLVNFKKIAEILGFDRVYTASHPKAKFWRFLTLQKVSCKTLNRKTYFDYFVNLSTNFPPRLTFLQKF